MGWHNIGGIQTRSYRCGYCGRLISSNRGYSHNTSPVRHIYICHVCNKPTHFDENDKQTPGAIYGNELADVEETTVRELYDEARSGTGNGAYRSAVLACRKLLMHIAVAKGAKEGQRFIDYVQYLSDKNYIPPGAKGWVDHIRSKGNEANTK